jgi:hypothetical protein
MNEPFVLAPFIDMAHAFIWAATRIRPYPPHAAIHRAKWSMSHSLAAPKLMASVSGIGRSVSAASSRICFSCLAFGRPSPANRRALGLYQIVTFQYSTTTLYQVYYHLR